MMLAWMHGWGTGFGPGAGFGIGGVLMMVTMVLFWALLIVGIVYAVRALSGTGTVTTREAPGSRALDILKERYAKGEIDQEEYETKKRELVG